MKKTIHVLLISDHNLIRAGIGLLLSKLTDVRVVGESDDAGALSLIGRHYPEVLLVVATLDQTRGLSLIQRIIREYPDIPVIDLCLQEAGEYAGRVLRAGIKGYLQKQATPADLELAVVKVAHGETYTSLAAGNEIKGKSARRRKRKPTLTETLTRRQREILKLVLEEYSSKEISRKLNISIKTVESHRLDLMRKLGVRNVVGLVRVAIQEGFI